MKELRKEHPKKETAASCSYIQMPLTCKALFTAAVKDIIKQPITFTKHETEGDGRYDDDDYNEDAVRQSSSEIFDN